MTSAITLKRSLFALIISALIFVASAAPLFAQTIYAPENEGTENLILSQDTVVDEDYFSVGETVTLDGTVNGDAYLGGGNVFVNGTVNGDLITGGGNVTVRGVVTGNIRAAGGNILISGTVGRNITALGGNVTIQDGATVTGSLTAATGNLQVFAPIGGGMTLGVGQATIANTVGGNITAGVGTLDLLSDTNVAGNLTYWSDNDANITPGATISGEVVHNLPPKSDVNVDSEKIGAFFAQLAFYFKIYSLLAALLVGLLLIKFAPRVVDMVGETATNQIGKSLLVGIAAVFLAPIAIFFIMLTLIGIPLGLIITAVFLISLYLAKIFAAFAIGKKIFEYSNKPKIARGWMLIVGMLILTILDFIPLVGWLISIAACLTGLGALFLTKKSLHHTLRSKNII